MTKLLRFGLILLVFATGFSIPLLQAFINPTTAYGMAGDRPAPAFELRDVHGQAVTLTDLQDRFVFLMFGYLNCRDICHSQALVFQEIDHLADMQEQVLFVYVAIDPERDAPQQIAAYFDGRGDNFISLHADKASTMQAVAMDFKAYFSRRGGGQQESYDVDHNGIYFLIDPQGQIRFTYSAQQKDALRVVEDLNSIKHEYDLG